MPLTTDEIKEFEEFTKTLNADFIQPGFGANEQLLDWISLKKQAWMKEGREYIIDTIPNGIIMYEKSGKEFDLKQELQELNSKFNENK